MIDEEPKSPSFPRVIIVILVVAFGWGTLWTGTHGLYFFQEKKTDFGGVTLVNNRSQTAAVLDNSSASNEQSPASSTSTADSTEKQSGDIKSQSSDIKDQNGGQSSLKIIIGGDVMLDRNVRRLGNQNGYDSLFAEIAPLFKKADIAVINLEGPITSNPSRTLLPDGHTSKELVFTFAPATASAIAKAGITVTNLANNHTDNFGLAGLAETKKRLETVGLKWFGLPSNGPAEETIVEKNGIKVAFVGFNAFHSGFENILSDVNKLSSESDFVIVMPHWGAEYASTSPADIRAKARLLVSAGADAVFGSHPHVILEHAYMGDVPVFYSLGNLLFDQYFSPETMKGNLVELDLSKGQQGTRISDIKIYETSTASRKTVTVNDAPMDF